MCTMCPITDSLLCFQVAQICSLYQLRQVGDRERNCYLISSSSLALSKPFDPILITVLYLFPSFHLWPKLFPLRHSGKNYDLCAHKIALNIHWMQESRPVALRLLPAQFSQGNIKESLLILAFLGLLRPSVRSLYRRRLFHIFTFSSDTHPHKIRKTWVEFQNEKKWVKILRDFDQHQTQCVLNIACMPHRRRGGTAN